MHLPTSPPSTATATTIHYLLATSIFSILFILFLSTAPSSSPQLPPAADPFLFPNRQTLRPNHRLLFLSHRRPDDLSPPPPPSIAYFISGSNGDSGRILRLLFAVYHPRNQYLLHLDLSASPAERDSLAFTVHSIRVFKAAQNVNVVGKADFAYPKGSSATSSTLHGASILLRLSPNWDWFINLSAADYPLVTQDDLLHILSYLPKDLNFVNHTSYIGWRESRALKPILVDPGLYLSETNAMFYATQKRDLPDAFQLFTGSVAGMLSRKLIEFCIFGTENFPRTLLMYLSNSPSAQSVYFPTLICNSKQFRKTIINHNLQYSTFDTRKEPLSLNSSDFNALINTGAAFASPFLPDDPVLDLIDQKILGRSPGNPAPGGWCVGSGNDTCIEWGDAEVLRPGPGARRLEKNMVQILSNGSYQSHQCVEFADEELECLSNKDAFPAVETCLDIIPDHRPIFSSHHNHLSPVSVLENGTSSSSNQTITSYGGALKISVSFPVRRRSKRRQRRRGFPELYCQQGWCQNINNVKQEQLKPSLSSQTVSTAAIGRRCQHCLAEKTPQWRAGPMGPKTLCNACGVRYKSGRLVPEYCPASSPTFSSELHSNSHRKIMEKRRKSQVGETTANGVCGYRVV